jgi:hypothetical protein
MLTELEKNLMKQLMRFQKMYETSNNNVENSHSVKIPETISCDEFVNLEYANTKIEIMFNLPYSDQQEGEDPNEICLDLSRNGKDGSIAVTLSKEEAMELAETLLKFSLTKKI